MKNILILLAIICLSACKETKTFQIKDIPVEIIDFESFKEINKNIPDKYIKNKHYVNISPNDPNLLFGNIKQIKIHNNQIFILDSRQRTFVVFDTAGNGIGKIGNTGRAPDEYLNTTSFSIDRAGNIHLIDGQTDKINTYNRNFKFIKSQKLPYEIDIIHCLSDGNFLIGLSSWNKMKNEKIIKADSNFIVQDIYCRYDEYVDHNIWLSDYYFTETANSLFYNRPLDNLVYEFSKTGKPTKAYHFNFGKKEIPPEIKKDFEKYEARYKNTRGLIYFTIITDNYILGQLREDTDTKIFLVDRLQNMVYLENKSLNSTLGNIIGCYGDKIISYISPGEYLTHIGNNKETNLPAEVKTHLENEGFVLCFYELNKDITAQ